MHVLTKPQWARYQLTNLGMLRPALSTECASVSTVLSNCPVLDTVLTANSSYPEVALQSECTVLIKNHIKNVLMLSFLSKSKYCI